MKNGENSINNNSIDELCKNISLGGKVINSTDDLLNYLNLINGQTKKLKSFNFSNQINKEFISICNSKNNSFFESINKNVKYFREANNKNVFILNNLIFEGNTLCFEIKLGECLYNKNFNNLNDLDIYNNKKQIFKFGFIKIKKDEIQNLNSNLEYSYEDQKIKKNNNFFQIDEENSVSFKKYKIYSLDIMNLFIPVKTSNQNNDKIKISTKRTIQKNDTIGIVIQISNNILNLIIYINGDLIFSHHIDNLSNNKENFYRNETNDDYEIEKNKSLNNILGIIPFLETNSNFSFLIKDKPNDPKIISNEKMEYFDLYESESLNNFYSNTFEIQEITSLYLEILSKIGNKIIKLYEDRAINYLKEIINFFGEFVFKNNTIIKSKILPFISQAFIPNKLESFEENIKSLFYIINNIQNSKKHEILKLIMNLLIELISEKSFYFLNIFDVEQIDNNTNQLFNEMIRYKFTLCYFLSNNSIIYKFSPNLVNEILTDESNFNILFQCLLSNFFIINPDYGVNYLLNKEFYINNNFSEFNEKLFIEKNFYLTCNTNNSQMKNILYNYFYDYYSFLLEKIEYPNLLKNEILSVKFINFLSYFSNTHDSFAIMNGVIIPFIDLYFKNIFKSNNDIIDKLFLHNYIEYKFSIFDDDQTLYGLRQKNSKKLNNIYDKTSNEYIYKNKNSEEYNKDKNDAVIFNIIITNIYNFYEEFSLRNVMAKEIFIDLNKKIDLVDLTNTIDFYQNIFTYNSYDKILNYANLFSCILANAVVKDILEYLPYKKFLYNIHFILDYLSIRFKFITKNNLLKDELNILLNILQNIFKYLVFFLSNLNKQKKDCYINIENYSENISLHIKALIKILLFDVNAIKITYNDVKDYLIKSICNLLEFDEKNNTNTLVKYLYSFGKDIISCSIIPNETREIFFRDIMKEEIQKYEKLVNENKDKDEKNKFLNNSMYFSIFMLIYKRLKIIRDSFKKVFNEKKEIQQQDLIFEKQYLIKFTEILNIFVNFLNDNSLLICYDNHLLFLKINSFLCNTMKTIFDDNIIMKIYNLSIYEENIVFTFFSQLFKLFAVLTCNIGNLNFRNIADYFIEIAANRKGFMFEKMKLSLKNYFGYDKKYKDIIDLIDNILTPYFENLCKEEETKNLNEIDTNSIEENERNLCPICLSDDKTNFVHINDCGHEIHLECLKKQLQSHSFSSKKCPFCRRRIKGIKEDPNFKVEDENQRGNNIFVVHNDIHRHNNSLFFNNNVNQNQERVGLFGNMNNSNFNNRGGLFGNSQSLFPDQRGIFI